MEIAREAPTPPADPAKLLVDALAGDWSGTLDYRDYGNDGRVVLPTTLHLSGGVFAWTFDDGPGKIVRSSESWTVQPGGKTLEMRDGNTTSLGCIAQFDIDAKGGLTFVVDGTVRENGRSALSRMIVSRFGNMLRLTQMTRVAGEPFLMRHSYEMRRL